MAESKEQRAERQARELWTFIDVLRRAGNIVEEEVRFDTRPADSAAEPPIPRKWRIDVALPCCEIHLPTNRDLPFKARVDWIAVEIEGFTGGFGGGHQRVAQFKDNIEKHGELFAQGWTLLRVSRKMIADGSALDYLARRGVRVESK